MKVVAVERIRLDQPIQLYDIQNTKNHNFIIQGNKYDYVSHNCGILDEVSFGRNKSVRLQENAMLKTYNAVKERMKSRFLIRGGILPTVLFMVSSKKSEHDFLEQYVKSVKNDKSVYVVDKPQWEVKPKERYSGKTFKVAIGNKFIKSEIIPEGSDEESYLRQGYTLIDVPIEDYQAFNRDIDSALMDIAGISSSAVMKFLSGIRIKQVTTTKTNPFSKEVISLGLDDNLQIKDFFDPTIVKEKDYSKEIYLHIDTSLKGDRTGLSAVSIDGAKSLDKVSDDEQINTELYYTQLFGVAIKAPSDSEISLEKTRRFIYYLKELGWNIKRVSIDGFQSADTFQILKQKGFNTKLLSLDRTPEGYNTLRAAINEKRIGILNLPLMIQEAVNLEKDNVTGKIDHPANQSKDLIDSLAGAIWSASLAKDEYIFNHGEDLQVSLEISTQESDTKIQLMQDLQKMLQQDSDKAKESAKRILEKAKPVKNLTDMSVEDQKQYTRNILEDNSDPDIYIPNVLNDIIIF